MRSLALARHFKGWRRFILTPTVMPCQRRPGQLRNEAQAAAGTSSATP
jgi:hypothetical protein